MFIQDSIVVRSKQKWKIHSLIAVAFTSGAGLLFGVPNDLAVLTLSSSGAFLSAATWACLSIRCPRCRSPWLWRAVNSRDHSFNWLVLMTTQTQCPDCGWPGEVPRADDGGGPVQCPRCGQVSDNATFCDVCGRDLRGDAPPVVLPDGSSDETVDRS